MIRFPIFLAALALATPVAAFDDLWHDLALVPGDPVTSQPAFYYAAPDRTADPRDTIWPGHYEIADGIYYKVNSAITGVNFAKVTAAFETGMPPDQIAIVHGDAGFAQGAPAALTAREFTLSEQDGFDVLSKGEDRKISIRDTNTGDPFMGKLGKSYRLAVADDYVALSFSTAQMADITARLAAAKDCETCMPWRDLLNAVEKAAGPDMTLMGASGYGIGVFLADPGETDPTRTDVPPFLLAMFAVTRDANNHATLFMSLLFPDAETADRGAEAAGAGIQALIDEVDEAESPLFGGKVSAAADGAIATLTVTFDHKYGGVLGYNRWMQLVMSRRFALLTPR